MSVVLERHKTSIIKMATLETVYCIFNHDDAILAM